MGRYHAQKAGRKFLRPIPRLQVPLGAANIRRRDLTAQVWRGAQNLQRNVLLLALLLLQVVRDEFARELLADLVVVLPHFLHDFLVVVVLGDNLSVAGADGAAPLLAHVGVSVLAELEAVHNNQLVPPLTVHGEEHGRVGRRLRVLGRRWVRG